MSPKQVAKGISALFKKAAPAKADAMYQSAFDLLKPYHDYVYHGTNKASATFGDPVEGERKEVTLDFADLRNTINEFETTRNIFTAMDGGTEIPVPRSYGYYFKRTSGQAKDGEGKTVFRTAGSIADAYDELLKEFRKGLPEYVPAPRKQPQEALHL